VFVGPVEDQDGEVIVAEGESLTYEQAETMDFFVRGVVGTIDS
jgi:basic membrane protein A and related proteins